MIVIACPLAMNLEDIAPLDELRLTVVVDNETDTLSSIDPGVPQVPEAVGLLPRLPAAREFAGHPGKVVFDRLCCACHGFSVLATGRRGDRRHTLLFDVGPYPSVWKDNAARLGIDLAAIEGVFLSHWHFDHSGGFPDVVAVAWNDCSSPEVEPLTRAVASVVDATYVSS